MTTNTQTKGPEGKQASKPGEPNKDAKTNDKGGKNFSKKKPFKKGDKGGKKDEFEQQILDVARVTRVMAGGKRMSFRVCVAIGDKKGRVAVGLSKGADISIAVNKAVTQAKKDIVNVPIVNNTIPHALKQKYGAAEILFKPSKEGRGILAGGIVRVILDLAGVNNITAKILGTNNNVNNAKCTITALRNLKNVEDPNKNKKNNKKEATDNAQNQEKKEDQGSDAPKK